jgi:hypothetical protein
LRESRARARAWRAGSDAQCRALLAEPNPWQQLLGLSVAGERMRPLHARAATRGAEPHAATAKPPREQLARVASEWERVRCEAAEAALTQAGANAAANDAATRALRGEVERRLRAVADAVLAVTRSEAEEKRPE